MLVSGKARASITKLHSAQIEMEPESVTFLIAATKYLVKAVYRLGRVYLSLESSMGKVPAVG